jgi:hypothetical protein
LVAVAGGAVEADAAEDLGGAGAFDAVVVDAEVAADKGGVVGGEVDVGVALLVAGFEEDGGLGAREVVGQEDAAFQAGGGEGAPGWWP